MNELIKSRTTKRIEKTLKEHDFKFRQDGRPIVICKGHHKGYLPKEE